MIRRVEGRRWTVEAEIEAERRLKRRGQKMESIAI